MHLTSRVIVSTLLCATVASAQARGLFLLDRSGSMLGTPCTESANQAKADIAAFFATFPTGFATVRDFNGTTGVQTLGGTTWHNNATDAQNAVDTASACSGSTPLADAICDSTTALLVVGAADDCWMYIYSDGGENTSTMACAGPCAQNWDTGSCDLDLFGGAEDYLPGDASLLGCPSIAGPDPSWQQKCCAAIDSVLLGPCDFVLNVYKFGAFAEVAAPDPGFAFLESASRASGGVVVSVGLGKAPGAALKVSSVGCRNSSGLLPLLIPTGVPKLGTLFNMSLSAGRLDRYIALGVKELSPGVKLDPFGGTGCVLAVQPMLIFPRGLLPLPIPSNPAFIGADLLYQGIAIDPTFRERPPLITSNLLTATIQR
ncbi:MAG: VWA domain-containing protein [Planctomycetota bacterium]